MALNKDKLEIILQEDYEGLVEAEKSYGDSWRERGGVGAFMMLARKWTDLKNKLQKKATISFML